MILCHVHAEVRPRWLDGFPLDRQRGRGDEIMGVDEDRTLQRIHTNFVHLTDKVLMEQVEDLRETMQCRVVGVP